MFLMFVCLSSIYLVGLVLGHEDTECQVNRGRVVIVIVRSVPMLVVDLSPSILLLLSKDTIYNHHKVLKNFSQFSFANSKK
mmetsp:Transcript_53004/g.128586  ORF Transcript_53004/g.128586 Transcript_53004/m.128586 type:complete len:81 (+) Transcript_53004:876-1118(+)